MAKSDWSAAREAAEKSGAIQSDRFKIQEGANRVRILSDFLPHTSYFGTGADRKRRFQWLGYVIDRKDGQIKTFFMPHSIHGMIEAYQKDPDWSFDETPLPYDLTINAKNAGTKDVEYSVVASPKRSGVTAEELALYATKKEIKEVQQAIYEKQNENPPQTARQYEEGGMPA